MGKDYTRKKSNHDFYQTPRPLTWELLKLGLFDSNKIVLECACGNGAISNILENYFETNQTFYDRFKLGDFEQRNFLTEENRKFDYIITNPPFSLFDEFVMKAKEIVKEKIAFIGKTNFFGAEKRNRIGVWKHLKEVHIFNRQVDYRFFREDNKLVAGNLITGWFIWDMNWNKNYWKTYIIDVQKYMLNKRKLK